MGAVDGGLSGSAVVCGPGWRRAVVVFVGAVLAGVLGVGQAHAALPSNCHQSGSEVSCEFSFTGAPDQTFKVPAGVSSVHIVAVGASGGASGPRIPSPVPGGAGAVAVGTVKVMAGQTLYVEVGGPGDDGFYTSAGGFNGGGAGDPRNSSGPGGGGGGGASDVRTASYSAGLSPDPRLLVAGGGGGAGAPTPIGGGLPGYYVGGAGGAAGQPGAEGQFPCFGGGAGGGGSPGTASSGGSGGAGGTGGCEEGENTGQKGVNGVLGRGGGGSMTTGAGGGGGGGGLYGGGQGGQAVFDSKYGLFDGGGGGGGGGSSLVPAGGSVTANSTGLPPQVTITYDAPRDSTSTAVSCSPDRVSLGHSTTCTATVTDTEISDESTPSGTVSFTSSGPGGFSGSPCTLSGSRASARCSVSYTPSTLGGGARTITAGYSGDATHHASSGHTDLVIVVAPAAPTITGLANGDGAVGVSFTDANPGTSPITSYDVTATDLSDPTAPPATATGPSSPVTVKGLTNGDTYVFTVTATSADGTSPPSAPSGRLNVGAPPVIESGPANGLVGQPYSSRFVIIGEPPPTVTQISGELPPGLTLSDDGALTGTPTTAGSYMFTVQADNHVGIDDASVTVMISPAPGPLGSGRPPRCPHPPDAHKHRACRRRA